MTLIGGAQIHSRPRSASRICWWRMAASRGWAKGLTVPVDGHWRVDAGSRYLVPGLVDPLAHITGGGGGRTSAFRAGALGKGKALAAGSPRSWRPSAPTADPQPGPGAGKVREFRAPPG